MNYVIYWTRIAQNSIIIVKVDFFLSRPVSHVPGQDQAFPPYYISCDIQVLYFILPSDLANFAQILYYGPLSLS